MPNYSTSAIVLFPIDAPCVPLEESWRVSVFCGPTVPASAESALGNAAFFPPNVEGGREGGRERKRDRGRERKRDRGREEGRERGTEEGRERGTEGGREGGREKLIGPLQVNAESSFY